MLGQDAPDDYVLIKGGKFWWLDPADMVQTFQLTKDAFRLEDSAVLTDEWGSPAATFSFVSQQDDNRIWTRVHLLLGSHKTTTISTTVAEQDREFMETIFSEVIHQLRQSTTSQHVAAG